MVSVLFHLHAEIRGGRLQEVAVAGRALGVQLEVFDPTILQDDDLDILSAHVTDDVGFGVEMERGLRMGHRLDNGHISGQHVLQEVLGITRRSDSKELELGPLTFHLLGQVFKHVLGVFDRVAFGKLVTLDEELLVFVEEHSLGGCGTAIDAHKGFHDLTGGEGGGDEFFHREAFLEIHQILLVLAETAPALLLLLFQAPNINIPIQLVAALVSADGILFVFAELHRPDGRKVLGVLRHHDKVLRVHAFGQRELALCPDLGNVGLPAVAHTLDVGIRAAEQQHIGPQRIPTGEHGEVLLDDGFEKRGHQLIRRHAALLQAVDVGLGKHTALAGHRMQLYIEVTHVAELFGGNFQLAVDLVDDGSGASGALVVHRGNLLLASCLGVFLEDDDFRVLPAQLDH